jgi:hypothetical protein
LVSEYAVEVRSGIIIKNAFNGFSQPLIGLISIGEPLRETDAMRHSIAVGN